MTDYTACVNTNYRYRHFCRRYPTTVVTYQSCAAFNDECEYFIPYYPVLEKKIDEYIKLKTKVERLGIKI